MQKPTLTLSLIFLLSGCLAPRDEVRPDMTKSHRLSESQEIRVFVADPSGGFRSQWVAFPAESVIASPLAIQSAKGQK